MILDDKGQLVYFKETNGTQSGDFKMHPNGMMSYSQSGKFFIMDSTFSVIDSVASVNGITPDLHDIRILPNGNYLLLGMENVIRDLSSYSMFLGNGTPGSSAATVRAGVVQELDTNKNVVFEWHAIDHFSFDDVDEFFLTNPSNVDWTHMNAVELDSDGNILISSRHFNEITKISRSDSSIIWRLGGKRNQFALINDSLGFLSQHDCRRIANGNITLFDNGRMLNPVHPASAKEYQLDETAMTATLVWSYTEDSQNFSRSQGNVQRLLNGNTLLSYGDLRPEYIVFNVVNVTGNKIFELAFDDSLITYRTYNYPSFPWVLQRPAVTCVYDAGQFYLEADSGYSSYLWSGGETSRRIAISTAGAFHVFVPYNDGAFISSASYLVTDPFNPCLINQVEDANGGRSLVLHPNPAKESLRISLSSGVLTHDTFKLFDARGAEHEAPFILNGTSDAELDISALCPGIYVISTGTLKTRFVKLKAD